MIDPTQEHLIPFRLASKHIPGNPSISALHRWRMNGVRGAKLETLLVGGSRFTSAEAIARFIAEQNRDQEPNPTTQASQRNREAIAAIRELEAAGL